MFWKADKDTPPLPPSRILREGIVPGGPVLLRSIMAEHDLNRWEFGELLQIPTTGNITSILDGAPITLVSIEHLSRQLERQAENGKGKRLSLYHETALRLRYGCIVDDQWSIFGNNMALALLFASVSNEAISAGRRQEIQGKLDELAQQVLTDLIEEAPNI